MTFYSRLMRALEERLATIDDPKKHSVPFKPRVNFQSPHQAKDSDAAFAPCIPAAALAEAQPYPDALSLRMPDATTQTLPIRMFPAADERRKCIVVPHWNAKVSSYDRLANILRRAGVSTYVLTLPDHGVRNAQGAQLANAFVSADLDGTVKAVRQAVSELQAVADWLSSSSETEVVVLGVSLGSSIAGLMSALKTRVKRYVLVLSAGDFAETVWDGRATRHIRVELDGNVTLEQLRIMWAEISPESYIQSIRDCGSEIFLISGIYDTVVPTNASERFVLKLREAGVPVKSTKYWCGHYTMGVFPFNVLVTWNVIRFILEIVEPLATEAPGR